MTALGDEPSSNGGAKRIEALRELRSLGLLREDEFLDALADAVGTATEPGEAGLPLR